jgi:uncharacterized protein (DUF2267 family)
VRARTKAEFLDLVRRRLERGILDPDPERVTRAVFKLVAQRVSEGEIGDVRDVLPDEVAELWPAAANAAR